MTKINRPHQDQLQAQTKKVDPSRHLVAESGLTGKVAKAGIHPQGKASEGFLQNRVSRNPKNKPIAKKVGELYSRLFPHKKVKHKH